MNRNISITISRSDKLFEIKLKEFKLEIEHLHLEHWYSNFYESIETLEPATIQEANEKPKFEFQRPFTPQKYSKVDNLMSDVFVNILDRNPQVFAVERCFNKNYPYILCQILLKRFGQFNHKALVLLNIVNLKRDWSSTSFFFFFRCINFPTQETVANDMHVS